MKHLIYILPLMVLCGDYVSSEINRYPMKILGLFPHPGLSHFDFFHPIMKSLAEAGHHVTVISHFPDKSPPARYKDLPLTDGDLLTNSINLQFFENRSFYSQYIEFFLLHEWGKQACNHTLRSNALAQVLRQKTQWDVIIMEQFNSDCMTAVAHILKAPFIALSSCALMPWHYERIGAPIIPSYIPALFTGQSDKMDFISRLMNWISFHGLKLMYDWITVPATDALVQHKFGHQLPSVRDLAKNTSLFFVNQHFSLSGVKPLPASVIELGGIHIKKGKPLDVELQRFLDNAEDGVIFISWGSMIRAETLPLPKRDAFLKAVRRLKQKVIWKWENETLQNKPDNMYISKWLPQKDILCHPNVKIFMTHAGLMGSTEAAYCGVPVIATPMYGDQFLNAAAMVRRGMGTILKYEDISEKNIMKAIKTVLEKSYMDNAKQVSYSFTHRPMIAVDTALWWVEYVAKTNGAPLTQSSTVHMPFHVYYLLDVYLLVGTILVLAISSWIWLIRSFYIKHRQAKENKLKQN